MHFAVFLRIHYTLLWLAHRDLARQPLHRCEPMTWHWQCWRRCWQWHDRRRRCWRREGQLVAVFVVFSFMPRDRMSSRVFRRRSLGMRRRIGLTRALGSGRRSVDWSPDRGRATHTQLTSIVSLAFSSRSQGASLTLAHQTPGRGLCMAMRNCKRSEVVRCPGPGAASRWSQAA